MVSRTIAFILHRFPLSLCRERQRKIHTFFHPPAQLLRCFTAIGIHYEPAFHRFASDVERAGMRLFEQRSMFSWINPHDHSILMHTACHVAMNKKPNSTEHFLFDERDAA